MKTPELVNGKKLCSRCKQFKFLEEFHKDSHAVLGVMGACKVCRNANKVECKKVLRIRTVQEVEQYQIDNNIVSKKCGTCGDTKLIAEFAFSINEKDGINFRCKECQRNWWQGSQDARSEEHSLKYVVENNIVIKFCTKCEDTKPLDCFYNQKASKDGKMAWCINCDKDRKKSKEHIKATKLRKKELRKNPKVRLDDSMSSGIYAVLKANKGNRKWEECVPYNLKRLIDHLVPQFYSRIDPVTGLTQEMTMNNYGEWHLEHKKPKCSFNYTKHTDSQFQECWGLNNLRPMWADENLEKLKEDKKLSIRRRNKRIELVLVNE